MANTVKIRRSGTTTSTPSSLDHGELAINYADDTLFWKDDANVIQSFVFQAYASATHKSSHATGGSDALTPSDIGAAPAASPAITGNATFDASSGVPVTITNTGSGNSFVVNDASGDTTPFVVDAEGRVGIGISEPSSRLSVVGQFSAGNVERIPNNSGAAGFYDRVEIGGGTQATKSYGSLWIYNSSNSQTHQFHSFAGTDNYINNGGKLGVNTALPASTLHVNGVITVSATSGSAGSYLPSVTFSGDPNTGFGQVNGQSDTASVFTAGHERVRVDSGGRVGIGNTSMSSFNSSFDDLVVGSGGSQAGITVFSATQGTIAFGDTATSGGDGYRGYVSYVHSTDEMRIATSGVARMYIDSAGNVGLNRATPTAPLTFANTVGSEGDPNKIRLYDDGNYEFGLGISTSSMNICANGGNVHIRFWTDSTERMRVLGTGRVAIGQTTADSLLHVNGVITVSATSGSAGSYLPSLTISGDPNTGFGQVSGQSDTASVFTAGGERLRVKADGTLHIGSNHRTNVGVTFEHALPNTVTQIGCLFSQYIGSAATTAYTQYIRPYLPLTGSISDVHFSVCVSDPKPAGVQVTRSTGYSVHSSIAVGSENNYAYRGQIAASAGGGNFNCYMDGTAPNFFAGNVGIGSGTTSPTAALDINANTIRLRTARTPASASAAGNAGDICWDADFVYICTATNTWRKAAITADGSPSIANDSITYAKIQNVSATDRLLGRSSAGAGDVQEITCTAFGRSLIDDVDAAAARGTLGAAPTASPTFTGTTTFNGPVKEGYVPGGNTGTAKTIALTNGTLQDYTLTGNCTFTMPSPSPGLSFTLMLRTGAGNYTATFTGVRWPGNSAPVVTTTANRTDLFTFINDGGNWYGNVVQGYAA